MATFPSGNSVTDALDIPEDTFKWLIELLKMYLGDNSKRQQFLIEKLGNDYITRYS